jgi:D-inositol-3-phosphate glycosyltransferase
VRVGFKRTRTAAPPPALLNPMKFVIIGTAYPLRGGIAHYVSLLYDALRKSGHEVKVITFSRQYPKILFPGKSQDEKGDAGIPIESVQIIDSINPFTWREAGKLAAEFEPDAVIFKFWLPFFAPAYGLIARTIKKAMKKKGKKTNIIFIADNVIPHEKRPGDRALTNYAFKAVDNFIVQSSAVERDLKIVKPDAKFVRLEHPVYEIFGTTMPMSDARRKLGIGDDAHVLLFFGFIRKYKGLDIILRAMPELIKKYPKMVLVVAGESYSGEDDFRALIKDLAIPDANLKLFTDYIPNDDVPLYFSAANVAVLPYRSATQSGIVQIAYNFDLPVIATDVGGLAEIVLDGKCSIIAPEPTPEAVAKAVSTYIDGGLEPKLRDGVREEKKKYSWETFVKGVEGIVNG